MNMNEYQVEYKNVIAIFQNAMAVIVEDDDGVYIPYERETWGDTFDDFVLNTLIPSLDDRSIRGHIQEKINTDTIKDIDLVIAWVGDPTVHKIYFFSENLNETATMVLQDEHMVDCIQLIESGSDEMLSLIPLSNSMVIISNTDSKSNKSHGVLYESQSTIRA